MNNDIEFPLDLYKDSLGCCIKSSVAGFLFLKYHEESQKLLSDYIKIGMKAGLLKEDEYGRILLKESNESN